MQETHIVMGMPITVNVVGSLTVAPIENAFAWFREVDERFSPYKDDSELMRFNRGEIAPGALSRDLREIFSLAEVTKGQTYGFFDIHRPDGLIDPSGLVKGWAIARAAEDIAGAGFRSFFVEAGGDVQCAGHNEAGKPWRIGIRNPFNEREIVKVVEMAGGGVATSGNYVRGDHIYDPRHQNRAVGDVVSLTVIAADIYDADRFATAAFAMGMDGIHFIEKTAGLEGYAISREGVATMTSGFNSYVATC